MGVVITRREHAGVTLLGMTFSENGLHDRRRRSDPRLHGPRQQFISSKKFLKAEGGLGRNRLDAQGAEGPGPGAFWTRQPWSCTAWSISPT